MSNELNEAVKRLEMAEETPEFEPIHGDIRTVLDVLRINTVEEPQEGELSRAELLELVAHARVLDENDHPQVLVDAIQLLTELLLKVAPMD